MKKQKMLLQRTLSLLLALFMFAGALLMPGITVGDNTVIGAGSVVTKDIPANVVAVGNPCRVMRPIGEKDLEYYFKDKKVKV